MADETYQQDNLNAYLKTQYLNHLQNGGGFTAPNNGQSLPALMPPALSNKPPINSVGPGAGTEIGTQNKTNTGIAGPVPTTGVLAPLQSTAPEPVDQRKTNIMNAALNSENPMRKPGVDTLYDKAKGIHNPFLRILGEIGARTAQVGDVLGTVGLGAIGGAPLMGLIPGTHWNAKLGQMRDEENANNMLNRDKLQSGINSENASTDYTNAKTDSEGNAITPVRGAKQEIIGFSDKSGQPVDPNNFTPTMQKLISASQPKEEWALVPATQFTGPKGEPLERSSITGQFRIAPTPEGFVHTVKPPTETAAADTEKYQNLLADQYAGKPISKEDQNWMKAYKETKLIVPTANNQVKVQLQGNAFNNQEHNQERTFAHQDLGTFRKTYVDPVNKADQALRDFDSAMAARGTDTTGAPSMKAFAEHISTTFGLVKGMRINKELIADHMGAQGIPDKLATYFQKMVNGDALSTDQWNDFRGLIKTTRDNAAIQMGKSALQNGIDPLPYLPSDLRPYTDKKGNHYRINFDTGKYEAY